VLITLPQLAYQVALGICRPVAATAASLLLGLTVDPQAPRPQPSLAPADLPPCLAVPEAVDRPNPALSPRCIRRMMQTMAARRRVNTGDAREAAFAVEALPAAIGTT
jgi:hypothetical protein